jgi:hypothetical protein
MQIKVTVPVSRRVPIYEHILDVYYIYTELFIYKVESLLFSISLESTL